MSSEWDLDQVVSAGYEIEARFRRVDFMAAFTLARDVVVRTEEALLHEVGINDSEISRKWSAERRAALHYGSQSLEVWASQPGGSPTMLVDAWRHRRAMQLRTSGERHTGAMQETARLRAAAIKALEEKLAEQPGESAGPDERVRCEGALKRIKSGYTNDRLQEYPRLFVAIKAARAIAEVATPRNPISQVATDLGCRTFTDYPDLLTELRTDRDALQLASSDSGNWILGMSDNRAFAIDLETGMMADELPSGTPVISNVTSLDHLAVARELGTSKTMAL